MRKWFIDLRLKAGKSQEDVARAVEVDRSYIAKLERGSRAPSVRLAKSLGQYLDFDWELFFEVQSDEMAL